MAEGWGPTAANGVLSAITANTAYAVPSLWLQLHVGPPGAAGTSNVAVNNVRKDASAAFASPSGGAVSNSSVIGPWSSVPATETYTHASLWTASSGGSFLMSGLIAGPGSVNIGDNWQANAGALTIALPLAS